MNYNSPAEAANAFRLAALDKCKRPIAEFALMAILGGAFIAFGGLLSVMVAGGMPSVAIANPGIVKFVAGALRSEEHTSELQSRPHLVCRLLLEKKKNK